MKRGDEENTCVIQYCEFKIRRNGLCKCHWKEHLGHYFAETTMGNRTVTYCPCCQYPMGRERNEDDICPVKQVKFDLYVQLRRQYLFEESASNRLVNEILEMLPSCPDCGYHCIEWVHGFVFNAVKNLCEPIGVLTIMMALVQKAMPDGITVSKKEVREAAENAREFGLRYETSKTNPDDIHVHIQTLSGPYKHQYENGVPPNMIDTDDWPTIFSE